MKLLFLIFHGFDEANGISKKIRYQVKAFKECGVDVHLCWLDDDCNGHKRRMVDESIIQDYGTGISAKILKRTGLNCIVDYIKENDIKNIYIRSDHNTTPFLINMLKKIKKLGTKIIMEIPTYPYDQEYKELGWQYQYIIWMDKLFRNQLMKFVDFVVTFSNHKYIFGRPTICIANGIDFEAIPKRRIDNNIINNHINLIAVATIHPWHGFDRAIKGMIDYMPNQSIQKVILHIVGGGVPHVIDYYKNLVEQNHLSDYVVFHGPLFGKQLDNLFNMCQIGIGSLGRHRSGITHLRSLKNREYAARDIPFVYSEIDDDFENMPYVLKISADDSNLNINQLIDFYKKSQSTDISIRNSIINKLSWKSQINIILQKIQNDKN